jgi:hypothetical protein
MACPYAYNGIFKAYGVKLRDILVGWSSGAVSYDIPLLSPYQAAKAGWTPIGWTPNTSDPSKPIPERIHNTSDAMIHLRPPVSVWREDMQSEGVANPPFPLYDDITLVRMYDPLHITYKGLLLWRTDLSNPGGYVTGLDNLADNNASVQSYGAGSGTYVNDVGFYVIITFGQVRLRPNVEYVQNVSVTFDTNMGDDYDVFGTKIIEMMDWFMNKHQAMLENDAQQLVLSDGRVIWVFLQSVTPPTIQGTSSFARRTITYTLRHCICS